MASPSYLSPARFHILGQMRQMIPVHASVASLPRTHLSSRILPPSSSSEEDDSPLDFSKKANVFSNNTSSPVAADEDEHDVNVDVDNLEEDNDPSSRRLRSALSVNIKSSSCISTILNLSSVAVTKESLISQCTSRSWSRASSPLSPSVEDGQPPKHQPLPAFGGNNGYSLAFSPWGSTGFPSSLSPGGGLEQQQKQQQQLLMGFQQQPTSPVFEVSSSATQQQQQQGSAGKMRATRPFKAYPKDPMSFPTVGMYGMPLGSAPTGSEALLHQQSHQAYTEFRKQMLASSQITRGRRVSSSLKGGSSEENLTFNDISMESLTHEDPLSCNKRISIGCSSGGSSHGIKTEQQMKDEAYRERRRKNNEAAKRSRDSRRSKEDEIAIRAAFLEQENLKLRFEVCALKNEAAKLRCMLST